MELQPLPFDVETFFAKLKKKQIKKLHRPDLPLYKAIWPMVFVVRVFGFAPYTFSQGRLVPSNTNLIFTTIAIALYSHALYEVCNRFMSVKREVSSTLEGTENAKVSKKLVGIEQKIARDTNVLSKRDKSRIYLFIYLNPLAGDLLLR